MRRQKSNAHLQCLQFVTSKFQRVSASNINQRRYKEAQCKGASFLLVSEFFRSLSGLPVTFPFTRRHFSVLCPSDDPFSTLVLQHDAFNCMFMFCAVPRVTSVVLFPSWRSWAATPMSGLSNFYQLHCMESLFAARLLRSLPGLE